MMLIDKVEEKSGEDENSITFYRTRSTCARRIATIGVREKRCEKHREIFRKKVLHVLFYTLGLACVCNGRGVPKSS